MLTRETELIGPDLRPPIRTAFQTSAVTVLLLCYFTSLHESNLKLRFLHLLCASITVNVTEVVIKILQGSAVTETV